MGSNAPGMVGTRAKRLDAALDAAVRVHLAYLSEAQARAREREGVAERRHPELNSIVILRNVEIERFQGWCLEQDTRGMMGMNLLDDA